MSRKADSSSADVPEQNAECIDVDAVIVLAGHQLGCHVQRRAYYTARHHCFWLTEPEVGQPATIVHIQLQFTISQTISQFCARIISSLADLHLA